MALPLTEPSANLACFTVAPERGAFHDREIAAGVKPTVKLAHFNAATKVLGNFTGAPLGTYHPFKLMRHADRYFPASQYRFIPSLESPYHFFARAAGRDDCSPASDDRAVGSLLLSAVR